MRNVKAGDNPPDCINLLMEIPKGGSVKYGLDLESGLIFVDSFLYTATHYPFNYGFIPQTVEADGDQVDAIVSSQESVFPLSVIRSRPRGALLTEDEKGPDAKIVAVPLSSLDPFCSNIESLNQLSDFAKNQITHFFQHYKETEPNKFVKIHGWRGVEYSKKLIEEAIELYSSGHDPVV